MRRRDLLPLLFPSIPLVVCAQSQALPGQSPANAVGVYLIPTDAFPERLVPGIATALEETLGLRVKAAFWTPAPQMEPFPRTNQYEAEDYLEFAASLAGRLPESSEQTLCVVMTTRDINSRDQELRFQFVMHDPAAHAAVLSVARMQRRPDGSAASPELVLERINKMLLRTIGELKLGWHPTNDPSDLMYAPVMSAEDIDRMRSSRQLGRPVQKPARPAKPDAPGELQLL